MLSCTRKNLLIPGVILFLCLCVLSNGKCEDGFEVKRIGNIVSYADNAFQVSTDEPGSVQIIIHDQICQYRILEQNISEGKTVIHWDGCAFNEEKLYPKSYTVTAVLKTDSGKKKELSFLSPVEYTKQYLQYVLPSAETIYLNQAEDWFLEYKTVQKGKIIFELKNETGAGPDYSYTIQAENSKIQKKAFHSIVGKTVPESGTYAVSVYEISDKSHTFSFNINITKQAPENREVTVTGEIMPDRSMSDSEIWNLMMRPSVVIDIDYFKHQNVYDEPDQKSRSLGTLHGQTQGLKVIRILDEWALIGAWNHEEAEYIEGWVPLDRLKVEYPGSKYGLLIDKQKQTMKVFENGKVIDTLLVSTGRAEKNNLDQETAAGCFLTGYHRVNFSMNGKKYDYVIQYDGGNLLHQTPYDWGQYKKDFTLGRGFLGTKASHACIRIQPEPGKGGVNAYWLFTHLPYHTRVIILDDPEERRGVSGKLKNENSQEQVLSSLHTISSVPDYSDDAVILTFGGSLTPGGNRRVNAQKGSFKSFVAREGYQKPLAGLNDWFGKDDFSVVNVCCPLVDDDQSELIGQDIYAPAEMISLFREASAEMILLSDRSGKGKNPDQIRNTAEIIQRAADTLTPGETVTKAIKGHLFGFAMITEEAYLQNPETTDTIISSLKEQQCEIVIAFLDFQNSNRKEHAVIREAMAHRCVRAGTDLVVGLSSGNIQGIDYIENVPVLYGLGDLLDGSSQQKDSNQSGILLQVAFSFGEQSSGALVTVVPISPSGVTDKERNDFCPSAALTYDEFVKLIGIMRQDSTDTAMGKPLFYLHDMRTDQ